jgi:DNA-binding beta-propeller fold protein YncE
VVGKGAIAIAVTPDGRTVYVGIYGVVRRHFGTVIPIQAATGKVLPSITVGELPVAIAVTP